MPGMRRSWSRRLMPAVVDQEVGVVGVRGRVDRDQHQDARALLLDGDALLRDFLRQARLRRRDAVLGEDVGDVLVGADLEVDVELHAAVAGVRRLHVDQPVHAVDFLLDRGRHRLLHRLGGRARIVGRHADVGRGEERILLDRQPGDGDRTQHDGQDRDDDRDDRTADEELAHGLFPPGLRGWLRLGRFALGLLVHLRFRRAARGRNSRVDLGPRPRLLDPVHDHPLAGLEAVLHDQQRRRRFRRA